MKENYMENILEEVELKMNMAIESLEKDSLM